jgi:hypothetical protein
LTQSRGFWEIFHTIIFPLMEKDRLHKLPLKFLHDHTVRTGTFFCPKINFISNDMGDKKSMRCSVNVS